MEKTFSLADEIAVSVSKSGIYKEFVKAKNDILKDPVLLKKMKAFKKAHIDFCNRRTTGTEIPLYDEINVSRMYFELLNYSSAKKYLKNEQILIELMLDIYKHISNSCSEIFTDFEE